MVYHYISPDMKQRALQLLQEGWEMDEIVNALDVSPKSIGWWSGNYEAFGHVKKPSALQGRRHALNAAALANVTELIRESPFFWTKSLNGWPSIMTNQSTPVLSIALCKILVSHTR
jgi:transposase